MASKPPPKDLDSEAQIEDWKRLAEEHKQRAEELGRRAEEEARGRQLERRRASEAEAKPTSLDESLSLVNSHLANTLEVGYTPSEKYLHSPIIVNGKYYPLELIPWNSFDQIHTQTLDELAELLGDQHPFPSKSGIKELKDDMSPTQRMDELDIRSWIRAAVEKPAQRIVAKNRTESSQPPTERDVSPNKKRSPERGPVEGIPDRWGIRQLPEKEGGRVLVGEYKAAHKLLVADIGRALESTPPDFFIQVLKRKRRGNAKGDLENAKERTAQVLCQIYHYMITSGVLYGYVASGETLVLLRVKESRAQTLLYYLSPIPAVQPPEHFEVQYSAAAQLATLAILALSSETSEMSADWISQAQNSGIYQWPIIPLEPLQQDIALRPRQGHDGSNESSEAEGPSDSSYDDPSDKRSCRSQKQNQESQDQSGGRRRSPRKHPAVMDARQFPHLVYCTQACILGLVRRLPLDQNCPNFLLHSRDTTEKYHAITREELYVQAINNLNCSFDNNCENLDKYGLFGHIGVLFRIHLDEYGYQFVAKGAQHVDEAALTKEANIYTHFLAKVTKMMLMSCAGIGLNRPSWPGDVDIATEKKKALYALESAGLYHADIRHPNLVWNPVLKRVLVVDFDQADILKPQK
ncbi:hypothetical protein FQN57_000930 [Myotisia sp. PD_48]|nr:hypothetical protein FQN57_000930 [Myotisia sp. PD_48]